MTTARWARVAAVCSAATMLLFAVTLVVLGRHIAAASGRPPGPYTRPLQVLIVALGVVVAAVRAWRYERLARGRFQGRPRWRVFGAWWALFVITLLIALRFPPTPWAGAAWIAALGWSAAATCAARLDRRAHP